MTNDELRRLWPNGREVAEAMRGRSDACILSFSCGKDSLAAWLVLREVFEPEKITPVYKYLVPGLAFVERSLAYYEDFFGCRIRRYPHPSFYRWLVRLVYQAPQNCALIEAARLPEFSHEHLMERVREDCGLAADTWVAVGTRACDSPTRRMAFARHGPTNETRQSFMPVWDWSKSDVVGAIRKAGVKLPADYRVFGRSFDGIDFRFLYGIKKHWPADYARILEFFPLAELVIKRHEYAQEAEGARANGRAAP
jgi:3'-phosphoadenosine 5'-phosphosulfate sulfotransferase (PAPS reductase)/FAD synthetase